ncbi:MarR family winged helix-turn-helix transcriptional regulator [Cellulomonas sp.]|uniref:MarR family winged helix-turn-helix transcriptional regulator n=1 Tax=Cellulomonas sp. TaxID=40001 RepID=UPI001B007A13|nr:MarR family winged helix-turn-helix transcriptional regulator [Cellulomonas sp.]MBO9555305.1 winged helix-turn-helix transcriptional regulator [Cellulomonas sp.]
MSAPADVHTVDLGWSVGTLLRRWREAVEGALAGIPDGARGYHVLSVVVHGEPPTQAALAAQLGIDRTVMTYLVDRFEGCGLVERRLDPHDRRARRLVATPLGVQTAAELERAVAAAEDGVLGALTPAERQVLRHLLARATADADAGADGDADRCAVVTADLDGPDTPRR